CLRRSPLVPRPDRRGWAVHQNRHREHRKWLLRCHARGTGALTKRQSWSLSLPSRWVRLGCDPVGGKAPEALRFDANSTIKQLSCCLALLAIAIAGPANGQQLANQTRTAQGTLGQALLIAIETWLSNQFDLPNIKDHPQVEFVPPEKIAALRSNGLLS